MFAHDLCHSQIEYFRNAIDLDRKDRAKRYHKASFFNRQSSFPVYPGWVLSSLTSNLDQNIITTGFEKNNFIGSAANALNET
jgi:hypothetical protein